MKVLFNTDDLKEIGHCLIDGVKITLSYAIGDSDTDSDNCVPHGEGSESDLSDFDPSPFECGEITPEVEEMVDNYWKFCDPLEKVYGKTGANLIKETVKNVKEETECVSLKTLGNQLISKVGRDQGLMETCTDVSYWCCCETLTKTSAIVAEATLNLMY